MAMNIPDEVIEAAAKAAFDGAFMRHAPKDVPRWDDEEHSHESWREVARVSAPVIAEWARKEALEEAKVVISRDLLAKPSVYTSPAVIDVVQALATIQALAEES